MKINIIGILKALAPQIILIITMYIIIILLPNKNIVSLTLAVLCPVLLYKLNNEMNNKTKPKILDWTKTILITSSWIIIFTVLYGLMGGLGIIGAAALIIIIVAWRIIKGWKLYSYTTKWAAEALHGKKTDFDIKQMSDDPKWKKE
jgi:hypothetical protein